jgi:hypothetical protein
MRVEFADCNNATLDYVLDDGTESGTVNLTRVVPETEALCDQMVGSD